jgi:hypothetical protein
LYRYIMTRDECAALVREADANSWAWHAPPVGRYGTPADRAATLLNVQELGAGYEFVMGTLLPRLLPAVAAAFPGRGLAPPERAALRLYDARLVR